MKKGLSLILIAGLIIFSAANVFALITVPLECSNDLPDGNAYATVTIELLPDACSGYDGVKITVVPNHSILIPTETAYEIQNYGIQRFGFNYAGDPNTLDITLYEADGMTVETQWKVKYSQNVSEFGVFEELLQGTGKHRHDPLIMTICKTETDLTEADFNVENADGNNFVAHIADFYYDAVYYETDSAYFADCPWTTLISLSAFTAKASNGRVKLEWVTEAEIDNAGFNIWRAEAAYGSYEVINEALIPAKGSSTQGVSYEFVDTTAQNRKTYYYKLEDIDLNGTSTMHGPKSATPRLILGILGK